MLDCVNDPVWVDVTRRPRHHAGLTEPAPSRASPPDFHGKPVVNRVNERNETNLLERVGCTHPPLNLARDALADGIHRPAESRRLLVKLRHVHAHDLGREPEQRLRPVELVATAALQALPHFDEHLLAVPEHDEIVKHVKRERV